LITLAGESITVLISQEEKYKDPYTSKPYIREVYLLVLLTKTTNSLRDVCHIPRAPFSHNEDKICMSKFFYYIGQLMSSIGMHEKHELRAAAETEKAALMLSMPSRWSSVYNK